MPVCTEDMCLYFLTNKRTHGGVGRVWSAVTWPLRISQKYASNLLKWWSLLGLLTGISLNNLFFFISVLYFYFFGCGGRRLKLFIRTPFLSYLWLHFECHWFLRIDRIICTHHFAGEKRQLWMLGTFLGYLLLFNQWRKTDVPNHNNTSTAKWAFAITVTCLPLGSPVCTDINQLFVALFIHYFII